MINCIFYIIIEKNVFGYKILWTIIYVPRGTYEKAKSYILYDFAKNSKKYNVIYIF